jgi:phage host-nuclease inhibitor protein Gam
LFARTVIILADLLLWSFKEFQMSFLNAMKNSLWTDDSAKKPAEQKGQSQKGSAQTTALPTGITPQVSAAVPVAASGTSTLDVAKIEEAINGNILSNEGFAPASKFLATADSLESVLKDEGLRFKAAAKTPGQAEPATLIDSINTFHGVLDTEKANFETQFCGSEQASIDQLSAQASNLDAQINDLAQQMATLNTQKQELQTNITTKTADLAKARIDFNSVATTIEARYTEIAAKIQKHLGVQ